MVAVALGRDGIGKETVPFVAKPMRWDFWRFESLANIVIRATDGDVVNGLVDCDVLFETGLFRSRGVSGFWTFGKRFSSTVLCISS